MRKVWESIQNKSKAVKGDKTLMDAYTPAVEAFVKASWEGASFEACFVAAERAAAEGVEATKEMIAKRGRGYYALKEVLNYEEPLFPRGRYSK